MLLSPASEKLLANHRTESKVANQMLGPFPPMAVFLDTLLDRSEFSGNNLQFLFKSTGLWMGFPTFGGSSLHKDRVQDVRAMACGAAECLSVGLEKQGLTDVLLP